jgi:hypothetical protein
VYVYTCICAFVGVEGLLICVHMRCLSVYVHDMSFFIFLFLGTYFRRLGHGWMRGCGQFIYPNE